LRIRDRSINRSREKSRENSRLGVLSREKLNKEKRWSLQTEGGGGEKPGGFPSSSSLLENGFFRRENGEFSVSLKFRLFPFPLKTIA
jgi:hypothetical protein